MLVHDSYAHGSTKNDILKPIVEQIVREQQLEILKLSSVLKSLMGAHKCIRHWHSCSYQK